MSPGRRSFTALDENENVVTLLRTDYIYDPDPGSRTHVVQVFGERDDEETVSPDDLVIETRYDGLGRVERTIDPMGHAMIYMYDELGRVTKAKDAELGETLFTYDQAGNRTSLADPEGNQTQWTYDALNRVDVET